MTHTLYTTRHGKASACLQAAVISALVRPAKGKGGEPVKHDLGKYANIRNRPLVARASEAMPLSVLIWANTAIWALLGVLTWVSA